ncbi:hypothetical protein GCM10009838_60020 [Catenulispora subtropica]|uniref:Uncharacterized protein n=1 Tax=Catenulispora subtropica TaxID=450798 RepID=A0ABP5E4E8_9ACTN
MLSADSSGEPVAAKIRVPSARPLTVCPATCARLMKKRDPNSGTAKSCRYVRMPEVSARVPRDRYCFAWRRNDGVLAG